jgi:hypothetical protein
MTSRFEGARRSKLAALQLLFVLHRRAAPLLFSSVNALNVTTKSWVTIQLVAPYDLAAAMSPITSALQFVPPAYRGRLTP